MASHRGCSIVRCKISDVWKICWRHSLELKFYMWSDIMSNFCFRKFKQLLLCKVTGYNRSDTYDRYCTSCSHGKLLAFNKFKTARITLRMNGNLVLVFYTLDIVIPGRATLVSYVYGFIWTYKHRNRQIMYDYGYHNLTEQFLLHFHKKNNSSSLYKLPTLNGLLLDSMTSNYKSQLYSSVFPRLVNELVCQIIGISQACYYYYYYYHYYEKKKRIHKVRCNLTSNDPLWSSDNISGILHWIFQSTLYKFDTRINGQLFSLITSSID